MKGHKPGFQAFPCHLFWLPHQHQALKVVHHVSEAFPVFTMLSQKQMALINCQCKHGFCKHIIQKNFWISSSDVEFGLTFLIASPFPWFFPRRMTRTLSTEYLFTNSKATLFVPSALPSSTIITYSRINQLKM